MSYLLNYSQIPWPLYLGVCTPTIECRKPHKALKAVGLVTSSSEHLVIRKFSWTGKWIQGATSTKAEVTLTCTPCSCSSLLHSASSRCALMPCMALIACGHSYLTTFHLHGMHYFATLKCSCSQYSVHSQHVWSAGMALSSVVEGVSRNP